MNWPPRIDSARLIPEGFLASTADLVGVLTHLAGPSKLHSSQRRRNQRLEAAALSALLRNIHTTVKLPPSAHLVLEAAPAPAPARTKARNAAQRRQYCHCGRCKWCLDNVRWDRIYNEKFADPMYYGGIVVRHNSSLAGAR
jgi:hypothetical protein